MFVCQEFEAARQLFASCGVTSVESAEFGGILIRVSCSGKALGKFVASRGLEDHLRLHCTTSARRGEVSFKYSPHKQGQGDRQWVADFPQSWLPNNPADQYTESVLELRDALKDADFLVRLKHSIHGGGLLVEDTPCALYFEADTRFEPSGAVRAVFYKSAAGAFRKNQIFSDWLTTEQAVELCHRASRLLIDL